jgi:hypothetical protein
MTNDNSSSDEPSLARQIGLVLGLPWFEIAGELWKIGRKLMRGLSIEGVYEVLEYESTLELKDRHGENAVFRKREKVRYLQDYIIAYQDQAWGDGEILINYHCTPGTSVDRYRSGYKTLILISLREVKNKGEVEEFNIDWGIHRGFLLRTGFWSTEVSHRTKQIKVQVVFPKNRPPLRVAVVEKNRQRTIIVGKDSVVELPDGRWQVTWERRQPRLYEQYILNWEW